uniref:Biogenesis of lysosome-related organelles complex 1 subunit 7 n=1 Tax=Panagrellus redivivus TaxID=6233 RepID=A0A7E4VBR4_PANRE
MSAIAGGAESPSETPIGGGNDMTEAIMDAVRPAVTKLDEQVKDTRKSQLNLMTQMEELSQFLKKISDEQPMPYDLEKYVRKMDDSRKRINETTVRLQNIHERMGQLQRNIARESFKKRQYIKENAQS